MIEGKILWQLKDANGTRHSGEKPAVSDTKWTEVEADIFEVTKDFNPTWLGIKCEMPDGSGSLREYEKNGAVWVRTFADNILPQWFAITAGIVIFVLPIVTLVVLGVLWVCGVRF